MIINLFLIIHVDKRQRAIASTGREMTFFEANVNAIIFNREIGILVLNVCVLYWLFHIEKYSPFIYSKQSIHSDYDPADQLHFLDLQLVVRVCHRLLSRIFHPDMVWIPRRHSLLKFLLSGQHKDRSRLRF